jgi:tRNA(fMet)-specific endonuclease VapC
MAYRVLPDTNIVVAVMNGDINIAVRFDIVDEIIVSPTVLGELYFGAEKSGKHEANLRSIEKFCEDKIFLPCDEETAKQYSLIRNALRIKGRPIPDNDIWIAALAMQHDLILITRDAHFAEVEGLKSEKW